MNQNPTGMTGEVECTGNNIAHEHDEHVTSMNGTFVKSSKYIVLGYSGLCQREGYIIIKQSVTVPCSLLYFGLASTVTKYKYCTLCDQGTA